MTRPAKLRCAIYTRKSSEEGLEQAFNSLDAQREACAAYILSQAGEGWECVSTSYDDGGYSGGSLERPALKQLMADVAAGRINVIVVYKVDRLTRSLADFAKIVEILDDKKASFVSVTQAFNTTTSMGRLTLNVLLSFAQFEREVTGERIRDKILASRKKGMWMGGNPPLGYDVHERKLVINEGEKNQVLGIFKRYLELHSVPALTEELAERRTTTKSWTAVNGVKKGGGRFTRGALYHLLRNRVYIGEATHKGQNYPGEHEAIVDKDVWSEVQKLLTENAAHHIAISKAARLSSPLQGLLYDDHGNLMTPSYTSKSRGRYRYYVSQAHLQHNKSSAGSLSRVPASAIEEAVERIISNIFSKSLVHASSKDENQTTRFKLLIDRVQISSEWAALYFNRNIRVDNIDGKECRGLGGVLKEKDSQVVFTMPMKLVTRGGEKGILINSTRPERFRPNEPLIKALARGWRWRRMLETAQVKSMPALARSEGIDMSYAKKLIRLAFLPPPVIEAILRGEQGDDLSLARLMQSDVPLRWATLQ